MSASSYDALPRWPGFLPGIDAGARDDLDPQPTEDIADEVTIELAAAPEPSAAPALAAAARILGTAEAAPAVVLGAGSVLRDRYVLECPLGTGGSSTVYRAVDLRREADATEGRQVAIKLLRPELRDRPERIARLQREFRQTLAVNHPGVVRLHDLDCDRGAWFIVMEYLAGESLARNLRRAGSATLTRDEALRIALAVGDALAHAHARGVTHGDVKPGNIFLTDCGEVRLIDFGVTPAVAAYGPLADQALPSAATRSYASPEVLAGAHSEPADDVYSLACVTCEMLTGRSPREGHGEIAAALPTGLDEPRRRALESALAQERSQRPPMLALVRALRGNVAAPPAPPATTTAAPLTVPAAIPPARSGRSRFFAGAAIAACLALMLGIQIGRIGTTTGPPATALASPTAPGKPASPPIVVPDSAPELPPPPAAAAIAPPATPAPRRAGPTGLVTFDMPNMIVSRRAVVAAIPLRHLTRVPREVEVSWRLVDGTARAGRDYGGPTSGVETFVEGNSFRILYVPIVPDPAAKFDRTFVVELTSATVGAEVGGAARVEVTIQGEA